MRQYRSLATVIEEVAVQSCHRSLGAVKNSRRLPTCRHCHLQGGCAAKSKEISDAPTLQSRHRCWGGFCTVLSSQSHRRQEFEEKKRCGRSRQQPIQQRDFRHGQEEVTNKKLTERVRTEEVQMGRHDKKHIANTWEWNITTINNREIGEDGNSGQVTSQNWLRFVGERVTRMRGISDSGNKCSTMPCALCCNLIYSFSSYYNHTFALVFHVLHLQIKKLFYMFAPVP